MIYSVTGRLKVIDPAYAVVEAGGVGYKCSTTTSTLAQLPPRESEVTLYTFLYLREDNMELFGFATEEELRCFRMLISVSGVGPKAALAILSGTTPQRLMLSIAAGDVKALKAPGVGPKLTQRIVLELRDKVSNEELVGEGFAALRGSQANDPFYLDGGTVRTRTNHSGGINGGITNGMPVEFEVTLRPTPSIARRQQTVDLSAGREAELEITGRHDPCIVPRALPVIEAAAALAACELLGM